ncbi:MAG: hypothetical protein AB1716_13225 [Planctomycetota bacterium]
MVRKLAALALFMAPALAGAQVLEDFEHGNPGLYTMAGGTNNNMTIIPAAAHNGQLGANFGSGSGPAFYYRTDIATSAGNQYYSYFRYSGNGRIYMGVNAGPGGAWSAVGAPNTSQIILQNNTGWGFVNAATAAATFAQNTWYVLYLDWAANGDMTVKLYDEAMTNLLAQTTPYPTGLTGTGGLSWRGFGTTTGNYFQADTFTRVPEPAALLGLFALALVARRR